MTSGYRTGWLRWLALALAVALIAPLALATERAEKNSKPAPETVEMFSAIKDGKIGVTLIPKDSTGCKVRIENKTDKPLSVKLPEAFAGVPVLAQAMGGFGGGGMGGGMGGGRGGGMGGGQQAFGGGMGGMGGGMGGMMGGMGGGMGMFNVPPEAVGELKVTTVCLEHGKKEPRPRPGLKHEIRPIEEYTDRVEVQEAIRMLGRGMMPQRVAQAAVWHLENEMSWQELAGKQLRFANGTRAPYFSPQEIQAAMQVTAAATQLAEKRQSDSKQDSLSQN
jgi:hypothetical protein